MKFVKVPLSELQLMKKCGLDNTVPSDNAHYDTIVAYVHTNPAVRWIFWERLKTMLKLSKPSERVLDFGSGAGVFLYSLSKNFKEVYGLDVETLSMSHIKNKFNLSNLRIIKNESLKLPFKDDFFDIIYAADVLEHIKDSRGLHKEFSRILKKGGLLIVSGPTENFLYELVRKTIFRRRNASDHFHTINGVMKQSSEFFKIDKVKVLPFPFFPGFKVYRGVNKK